MESVFYYKNKKIKLDVKKCNTLQKISGLMFTSREEARALLFELKKPIAIHSCFVFFPFIAIWLNNNKIVEIKRIKPFMPHIKPKKRFNRIIEIPINKKYSKIITVLDNPYNP